MHNRSTPLDEWVKRFIKTDIRPYAVLLSVMVSLINIHLNPVINSDAVTYLRAAENYLNESYSSSVAIYERPFFPILLASLSHISSISVLNVGYLINILCNALIIFCFITIVRAFDPRPTISFLAAIIILLFTNLNQYIAFIIRDYGFWAFMLASILCLIRFVETQKSSFAFIYWPITTIAAALFRTEGIVLFFVPLSFFFIREFDIKLRTKLFAKLYLLPLIIVLIAFIIDGVGSQTLMSSIDKVTSDNLGFYHLGVNYNYDDVIKALRTQVLNSFSEDFAPQIFIVSLSYILIFEIISTLTLPYTALLLFAIKHKFRPLPKKIAPIYLAACLGFFVLLSAWIFISRFVAGRYILALDLLLLLLTPQALYLFYTIMLERNRGKTFNWITGLVGLYFFVTLFYSYGSDKSDMEQGIAWLKQNLPADAILITNHVQTAYMVDANVNWDNVINFYRALEYGEKEFSFKSFEADYFVMAGKENEESYMQFKALWDNMLEPLVTFKNNRDHYYAIYRRRDYIENPNRFHDQSREKIIQENQVDPVGTDQANE